MLRLGVVRVQRGPSPFPYAVTFGDVSYPRSDKADKGVCAKILKNVTKYKDIFVIVMSFVHFTAKNCVCTWGEIKQFNHTQLNRAEYLIPHLYATDKSSQFKLFPQ